MKYALAVLALVIAGSSAARAAEPVLIDRWNGPVMERLLTSLGASDLKRASLDGQAGLIAHTVDGLNIGVYAKSCTAAAPPAEPFCRGVEGLTSFDSGPGVDRTALADRLNRQYAAGKFLVERDGSIRLTRYIDVNAGVSEANLRVQLAGFIALAKTAEAIVWAEPAKRP